MSAGDDHRLAARANLEAAQAAVADGASRYLFPWATTMLFYVVVQLAEAALSSYPDDEARELSRYHDRTITRLGLHWPGAAELYEELQQLSVGWRYNALPTRSRVVRRAFQRAETFARIVGERWPPDVL